ncbi:PLP-dependent transferase [Ramlibacter sp. AW1]|uniref:PLP-dependent transferase n=1 Tax=Ramlibacter aurantiacus TaxID=2801330 RepID=A0A936ZQX0_9BURK|nr:PLP-dependent transferase [Ramlibacter aurantiacus]MBL0422056.1 PLP-dependent transferase [Ramlibacter aurantiacus]
MRSPSTDLIHHPYQPPAGFSAPQPGVYKASTVFFPNVAAMRARDWKHKNGYTYGLHGTPTSFLLEERIATLEGGAQCLLLPSGLAALAHVNFALLGTGDQVLVPDNAYGPLKALAEGELARWGIRHQRYDPMDPEDLARRIDESTRLVWVEAPGSVTMEFPPLRGLSEVCRARGVQVALDNTWGAGLAFNGFDDAGADIVIQALTKYPSGGGDVLMGSVVTRQEDLHMRLKATHMRLGWGVGANDVEAVLRSLPTLELRYRAQDQAARRLAQWLMTQSAHVSQVLHPALEGSPGHENWRAACGPDGRAAGLFSVVFEGRHGGAQVDAFVDALRLFRIGYSWGGPISLVVPYDWRSMRRPDLNTRARGDRVVRFSIGLESPDDLLDDLRQALRQLD